MGYGYATLVQSPGSSALPAIHLTQRALVNKGRCLALLVREDMIASSASEARYDAAIGILFAFQGVAIKGATVGAMALFEAPATAA